VERTGVKLYSYQLKQVGNAEGYFAPIVASETGESFVIGTRSDLPEDAPFQAGKSHPYAIWVDARGKVVWERSLRSGKTFRDYQGGGAVATPDGAFIAFVLCYVNPAAGAASRLVKLDRKGRTVWEWTSPIGKEARFPDELRLLPSGTVLMKGHLGTSRTPWVGELDAATGKLLRDEVGSSP
jgi:outer membrane protein assembly factor BamB